MNGRAWQVLGDLPSWQVTQIPRRPHARPGVSPGQAQADLGMAQRLQALVPAFHYGAPVAFGWIREQAGGPVRVLAPVPGGGGLDEALESTFVTGHALPAGRDVNPSLPLPRARGDPDISAPAWPFYASSELVAALARPPARELPGLRFVLRPDFDVTPETAVVSSNGRIDGVAGSEPAVPMGTVLDWNRVPAGELAVPRASLNRHVFVCGATGAGKSQTVRGLLEAAARAGIPWLVVEPAKAEYRLMAARLCGQQEPEWLAPAYQWALVLDSLRAQHRRDPESGPHPRTPEWEATCSRAIPGRTCASQLQTVQRWHDTGQRDQQEVRAVGYGTRPVSVIEQAAGARAADPDWEQCLADALTAFQDCSWPLDILCPAGT